MSLAPRHRHTIEILKPLAHLLVVVIGWVGFVWLWLLVAARPWDSQGLTWLILGSLLLMPLITGAWVLHNRSLHRRKGDRQAVATADMSYAQDWHGREVQADWATLRRSRRVIIEVEGEHKRYRGGLADEPRPKAMARAHPGGPRPTVTQDSPQD